MPSKPYVLTPTADSVGWEFHREQLFLNSDFTDGSYTWMQTRWVVAALTSEFSGTYLALTVNMYTSGTHGSITQGVIPAYALDSWTRYYVKVRHLNSNGGWSPWSDVVRFYSGTRYITRDIPNVFLIQP